LHISVKPENIPDNYPLMSTHRDKIKAAVLEVRAIYAELARRPVERQCEACTECCQFHLTGLTPQLTKGEAVLAAKAFRATGRKTLPEPDDGTCPLLKRETGRCLIYADRPFGCRTHFCAAAGGPYARKEVLDLIRRLEAVDQMLGGDGPHAIQSAVADALAEI
jgi:Fe-S-cluster containining protein